MWFTTQLWSIYIPLHFFLLLLLSILCWRLSSCRYCCHDKKKSRLWKNHFIVSLILLCLSVIVIYSPNIQKKTEKTLRTDFFLSLQRQDSDNIRTMVTIFQQSTWNELYSKRYMYQSRCPDAILHSWGPEAETSPPLW